MRWPRRATYRQQDADRLRDEAAKCAPVIAQFPHCDSRILHHPDDGCDFCNAHPEWQELREAWGIAFTGHTPRASLPKCGKPCYDFGNKLVPCQLPAGHDDPADYISCSSVPPIEALPCPADYARPPGSPGDHRRWGGNRAALADSKPDSQSI